ncbi:hypothetical protein DL770_005177 [Monosporascus sp. CRB-9-2]|nr:hypothetical protein DL770_005177 [Monosporascus sp. CRB-9-2]
MSLDQLHLLPPAQQEAILNGPAHAPPPGVIPNFEDPPNNNTSGVAAASSLLSLDMYSHHSSPDRYCLWSANEVYQFLSVAFFGCIYHIVFQVGFFVHQWDIRVRDLPVLFYDVHLASDFYVVAIMLYKAAILLEWMRIFVPRDTRGAFYSRVRYLHPIATAKGHLEAAAQERKEDRYRRDLCRRTLCLYSHCVPTRSLGSVPDLPGSDLRHMQRGSLGRRRADLRYTSLFRASDSKGYQGLTTGRQKDYSIFVRVSSRFE